LTASGAQLTVSDWEAETAGFVVMTLLEPGGTRVAVIVNRTERAVQFHLPERKERTWTMIEGCNPLPPRTVAFAVEERSSESP
jgi:pullulanase/glycogen debranching enzyme